MNINIGKGGSGQITSTKGGSGKLTEKKYIDLIPSPNNLRIHFDPAFYKNFGNKYDYVNDPLDNIKAQYDPWYLKEFRDYNIGNVVPSRPLSKQWIQGGPLGTSKAQIINNTLSYIKDPNNNDLEEKRFESNYGSIFSSQNYLGITPPVENKKPFLILSRDDTTGIYSYSVTVASTLNIFVRLQRPLAHLNPQNPAYVVREKKGIFCTYGILPNGGFSIGYRSPHHYINGDRTYKLKFEPFSFVFSLGYSEFSSDYNRPAYQTLMTDFKFKFGEMYMLTVVTDGIGNVLIYVNGILQSVARVPFNPLRKPTGGKGVRQYNARKTESPIGPNFIMFDGSTYPHVNSVSSLETSLNQGNAFIFGKSNLNGYASYRGSSIPAGRRTKRRKRFFNNIDLGVINTYNIALSQTQISQFYENFRYRYE
jgi:hypothetical protein